MTGPSLSRVVNARPGWYRSDFYIPTSASDGHYPASQVVEMARAEGLDLIAITDHNTIGAFSKLGQSPDFLAVPDIEMVLDDRDFKIFAWRADATGGRISAWVGSGFRSRAGTGRKPS